METATAKRKTRGNINAARKISDSRKKLKHCEDSGKQSHRTRQRQRDTAGDTQRRTETHTRHKQTDRQRRGGGRTGGPVGRAGSLVRYQRGGVPAPPAAVQVLTESLMKLGVETIFPMPDAPGLKTLLPIVL